MEMGTLCDASDRRSAVTVISSSIEPLSLSTGALLEFASLSDLLNAGLLVSMEAGFVAATAEMGSKEMMVAIDRMLDVSWLMTWPISYGVASRP